MKASVSDLHPRLQALIGTTFAHRYRVESLLAVGGMAVVFAGRHEDLDRKVAIKVMSPHLSATRTYAARFDREARSLSRLDHDNCLRVFDYGRTSDEIHYLVTEFIPGRALHETLLGPTPPATVVARVRQILQGLAHAHARGVVHRDLKPDNVIVSAQADGREVIKIVDFGIAKLVYGDTGPALTEVGVVFGTAQYMSPEQARGDKVDHRSDLYSAGVLMYAMLTGAPPFDGDDPVTVVRRHVYDEIPSLPLSVPPALTAVVRRLLARNPAERYQSALEVVDALDAVHVDTDFADAVIAAEPKPAARRGLHWATVIPIAALGLVGIVLADVLVQSPTAAITSSSAAASSATPRLRSNGPREVGRGVLVAIDRLLAFGHGTEARQRIKPRLDDDPGDPALLWRDGKALALLRKPERALGRYTEALVVDPKLLDDREFFAELTTLMHLPLLEEHALDLALQHLDHAGNQFLLQLVNRRERPLGYVDRHRILEHLRAVPSALAAVDPLLTARLDLVQLHEAPEPCDAYAEAITVIGAHGEAALAAALEQSPVPSQCVPEDRRDLRGLVRKAVHR